MRTSLNPCSRWILRIGLLVTVLYYFVAVLAMYLAGQGGDLSELLALRAGCLEAAPAALAAAAIAALLGDIILENR